MEKIWELILLLALAGVVFIIKPKGFHFNSLTAWREAFKKKKEYGRKKTSGGKKQPAMDVKKVLRDVAVIAAILGISLFVEGVVFQWNALGSKAYEETVEFDNTNGMNNKLWKKIYEFELDGRYVSSIYLNYESDTDIESTIDITYNNGYQKEEEKEVKDTASALLGRSAVAVNARATKIQITVRAKDAEKLTTLQIVNHPLFKVPRFLLLFSMLLLGYLFVSHRNFFTARPEWMYALIAVPLGTVIILSAHHSFDSWDEQIHFHTAYTDSWLKDGVAYTNPAMANSEMRVPTGNTYEEEQWIGSWLNSVQDEVVLTAEKGMFIKYNERAYLPQIAGLYLARKSGLSYVTSIFLAKFFNLLFCVAVVACAIHYSKYGKRLLFCAGLLPTTVFLFASFTYDTFLIALLMLGVGLFVTEYLSREKLNPVRTMVSIVAMCVGCFPKAVYIPFLALYWLMPQEKFESKRQKWLFKIAIFVLLLIMFASFVLPLIGNVSSGADVGDYRGGDTSQTSQLSMVLGYPLTYTVVLLRELGTTLASYFIGPKLIANFAYRGIYDGIGYYVVMLTMLFVFLTDYGMTEPVDSTGEKKKLLPMKIWNAILIFGTASLVWTALYLDFTPVGSMVINGVSPRYYLPLVFPLGLLFMNRKIRCNMKVQTYQMVVTFLMMFGTGATVYFLMAA